ncbi:myeloid differentiation primary response protein MyD88-like [Gigantopelta aegis]|uniref:myeloid differentiation primary response protein MyD88-like n=1 Tax=Gigantopelta aegis TaxID=1735272 RepID=UPI001B8895BC|nr:myeloid differentiation primary response protein MyD88-like [Gigantopelta aegis]
MEESTPESLDVIPSEHRSVSLHALRVSSRKRLSLYLNLEGRLPNEDGVVPDFNGLAELVGFCYLEIKNFARDRDPTAALIDEWSSRSNLNPTLGRLVDYLGQMGREDVLTDCKTSILADIEVYLRSCDSNKTQNHLIQDDTVSQSIIDYTDHHTDETKTMTTDDVESGRPTYYDAFVCYNPETDDLQFVKKMISILEGSDFSLKLFVPWRNDLPGGSKYVIDAKLIQDRCRRLIIILSPQYLKSPACDFQTKFAQSLSPGSRSKRLVPVLIEPCQIPQILHHVTLCDFTKDDLKEWFWHRLASAVRAPIEQKDMGIISSVANVQLSLDLSSSTSSSVKSDLLSIDVPMTQNNSPSGPSPPSMSAGSSLHSMSAGSSLPSMSSSSSSEMGSVSPVTRKKKKNAFTKLFSQKH